MRLTHTVRGPLDAGTAWERYARPAQWPTWAPQITGVDTPAERLAPGLTGRVRGPLGVALPFEVLAVDEAARTWSWRLHVGPLAVVLEHGVRPDGTGSGAGTATWVRIAAPAPLAVAYLPVAHLALRRLVR